MLQREYDRLWHKHPTGLFVDGGGEDVGVDGQGVVSDSTLSH